MEDLDSTQALLDSTIATPTIVDSIAQDSEEEEIFFGNVSEKEKVKSNKFRRRDTVSLSESVTEWRKMNLKGMSRSQDSLLSVSSSGSNRRSSLLSQENSITEEEDDEVFDEDSMEVDSPSNDSLEVSSIPGEVEISTSSISQCNKTIEISGIEPLKGSTVSTHSEETSLVANESVSGIYDSFSEDTAEESLHDDDEVDQMDHVRRQILQDSTLMSVSSSASDEVAEEILESEPLQIPTVVVHEATLPISSSSEYLDARPESPEEIAASPASQYYTAPSSRRHTSLGSASLTFDTTAEEMALYEMFGQDYDEIVEGMSNQERAELKEKITNRSEDEMKVVAEKLKKIIQQSRPSLASPSIPAILEEEQRLSIGSDVSPFSLASTATPSPCVIPIIVSEDTKVSDSIDPSIHRSPLAPPPDKRLHLSFEDTKKDDHLASPIFNHPNNRSFDVESSQIGDENVVTIDDTSNVEENLPIPIFPHPNNLSILNDDLGNTDDADYVQRNTIKTGFTNNFMIPTASSLNKMVKSPSPRKPLTQPVWLPPSPSPSKLSIGNLNSHSAALKSPVSSSKRPAHQSRLPQLIRTPQNARSALTEVGNNGVKTPNSIRKADAVKAAYKAIASPVATFVKNNPAPHLVENIKAKDMADPLESTLVEVEEKENNARLSLLPSCPLPSAVYKASSAQDEDESAEAVDNYEYVTEAYGAITHSAKVTKHVARVKVPNAGLSWSEDLFVNDESVNSSPSVARFKEPGRSVLKMTRRDSGLFDESMMNVSVVETKVAKKIARTGRRGTGRGRGKKK